MNILPAFNASVIGQVAAFVGVGALIDIFISDRQRDLIASYIFRDSGSDFSSFEKGVISALVGMFRNRTRPDRLSRGRVFIYSILVSFLFLCLFAVMSRTLPQAPGTGGMILAFFFSTVILAICTFPFDLFSIHIVRRVFLSEHYSAAALPGRWLLAIGLSLLPDLFVIGLAAVTVGFRPIRPDEITLVHVAFVAAFLNGISSILVSIVQALIIIAGFCLRCVGYILNPGEGRGSSRLREHPITLCFLVAAIAILAADWAW